MNVKNRTKGSFYTTSLTHPLVNSPNIRHTEVLSNKLHPHYAYLQEIEWQGEAVTGVVERVETNPNLQIICRIDGRDGIFNATLPSMYPTGGTGKSVGIPTAGQRFAGIKRAYSHQIHISTFFNLMSDVGESGTEIPLKPVTAGATIIKCGGVFGAAVALTEAGTLDLRSGNNASCMIDGAQGKKTETFIRTHSETHGNTQVIDFHKDDMTGLPNTSSYLWSQGKHQDVNMTTDKWYAAEAPNMMPGLGPYIDKTVIKAGLIKGDDPIVDMGHCYEISTRQSHTDGYTGGPVPMTMSLPPPVGTDKSCWATLQMGKQKDNTQHGTSRPGGELFSIRTKDFYAEGWPGAPQPQTQLFRLGKLKDSDNDLFTLRCQYGGGLTNLLSTGEGWDIDSKFHESHSLSWGGNGGTYIRENHQSIAGGAGGYDVPHVADLNEGVVQNKTYSQSGALKLETIAYNSAGPFPETVSYMQSINSAADWWARTLVHSDGAVAGPTETSLSSTFGSNNFKHQYTFSETAGTATGALTIGNDIGELKVVSGNATYTINVSGTKVTIKIEPEAGGDTQSITMNGAEVIIDAGSTPTAGKIKIGGSGSEQALVTKAWVETIFMAHVHPTAAPGPPSPPIVAPAVGVANSPASPLTFEVLAE